MPPTNNNNNAWRVASEFPQSYMHCFHARKPKRLKTKLDFIVLYFRYSGGMQLIFRCEQKKLTKRKKGSNIIIWLLDLGVILHLPYLI